MKDLKELPEAVEIIKPSAIEVKINVFPKDISSLTHCTDLLLKTIYFHA
jgi:hypothetical protein